MKLKILFFASLRDYVGARTTDMEIPSASTVAELKDALVKKYPQMAPARSSIMVAVNREYASDEQVIPLDAEIALFPPVSGG